MKTTFVCLSFLISAVLNAQTSGGATGGGGSGAASGGTAAGTTTSGTTAAGTSTGSSLPGSPANLPGSPVTPRPPGTPVNPNLPGSPVNSGLPTSGTSLNPQVNNFSRSTFTNNALVSLTDAFGTDFVFTSPFGTNLSIAQLQAIIANLQVQVQQSLPVIAAFNDSFEFGLLNPQTAATSTGPAGPAVAGVTRTPGASRGAPLIPGSLPQTSSGSVPSMTGGGASPTAPGSLAQTSSGSVPSLTANRGAPTSGSLGQTASGSVPSAAGFNTQGTLTPTGVTNAFGLAPGFGGPGNTLETTAPRDAIRTLFVLQTDLERLLPLLTALNGGTSIGGVPNVIPGVSAGSTLTNSFGPRATTGGAFRPLTPTGRPTGQ